MKDAARAKDNIGVNILLQITEKSYVKWEQRSLCEQREETYG